jgi:peptide/nickel transport system permease protein
MLRYALRRLLLAVPTLTIISVAVFLASQSLSDDLVAAYGGASYAGASNDPDVEGAFMAQQAANVHVDLPNFYIGISNNCLPDTFYKIQPAWRKRTMRTLALQCGQWAPVQDYQKQLAQLIRAVEALPDSMVRRTESNLAISTLKTATDTAIVQQQIVALERAVPPGYIAPVAQQLRTAAAAIAPRNTWGYPVLHWYGTPNQYHNWLTRKYAHEATSPWKALAYPLPVTVFLKLTGLLLSMLLAIPFGMYLANNPRRDRWGKRALLLLYVAPIVLIGCGLRYLFATPGHGFFLPFIGGVGTGIYNPAKIGFWQWVANNFGRLLLPMLTIALHNFALIALQMRSSTVAVLQQDYIRTARAKGLSQRRILWRHVLPNAIFPILVIFGSLFPMMLGGALLVELIFGINGLGWATYHAVLELDYPVLMTVVLLSATLTIVGSLVADLLMAWVDPRLRR